MKKQLKILLLISAFFSLAGGLFGPLYAVFVEQIGGDLLTAGIAYSIFAIISGVLIFVISKFEDKVKHKEYLIIFGYTFSCLGFLGYIFVQNPLHLFLVQIFFGISEAISSPAYDGIYSKFLEKGKFVSQWGIWESMTWIIYGVAALVGGYLANVYGFRIIFIIMFILSLIGLSLSFLLIKKK